MVEKEFNLLYEKWILVRLQNNQTEKWSLLEIFERAHEARELSGELPTQNIVIFRLLLAIMHSIFPKWNSKGEKKEIRGEDDALQRWKELWELNKFPYKVVETYLKQHEERFWLFHPEFPFYQVSKMGKSTEYGAGKLIGELSESSNKVRLFASRSGSNKSSIEYDEAARWLLYVNAFDDTSAKPTKSGLPSPGAGWLGQLGLVFAKGENLFEMLLLNFVLLSERDEIFNDANSNALAYWELPEISNVERKNILTPKSQKELLTIQSRRLQLKREKDKVIGFRLLGGDFFSKESTFIEQMTLWREDKKTNAFLPKRHRKDRQIWRDFASLVASAEGRRRPGIVHWIGRLKDEALLDHEIVELSVTGVQYGDKDFFVDDIIDDSIKMNASLFADLSGEWIEEIIVRLEKTDQAVWFLGYLASEIATAEGDSSKDGDNSKKKIREFAREKGYQKLDVVFREWLLSVVDTKDRVFETKLPEWDQIAKNTLLREGKKLLNDCSERAIIGFIKNDEIYSAARAFQKFQYNLTKLLGKEE